MSNAYFYQTSGGLEQRQLLAARLTEHEYEKKHRVVVLCDTKEQALAFDEYLWTFNASSFIPHNLLSEAMTPPPPVVVATIDEQLPHSKTLINLSTSLPNEPQRFQRIIEIICDIDEEKNRLRDFYRQYQTQRIKAHFIDSKTTDKSLEIA